ncbi:hypothetical protein HLB23_12600 [Nocardia uniformis]|uniref:Uncharacterized protein n=1 Tax=Nocardia uniformis TaxID=53432 RepID=A0A849BWR4_9NOCA|nr:hypothetical protein [Nocardia uniformis]NNH70694.1 hypothetical protein [Nocardia uniformis]
MSANLPLRLWRVQPWNPNPLMRASDRCEALVWLIAVFAALMAVPIAGAVGTASYTGAADRIAAEDAGKTRVTATVTDTPETVVGDRSGVRVERFPVTVRWNHDGNTGSADLDLTTPAIAGTHTPVWIDRDGNSTTAPARTGTAAAEGIGTGVAILVETWCVAAVLVWATRGLSNSRRNATWDREWRTMNNRIGRDTF